MAELPKLAFRATEGLDAAGEKIINVKKTTLPTTNDKSTNGDGVSVDFFVEHNSIQQFDETRSYFKYQAAIYKDRAYYAKENIPVGPFNVSKWQPLRVDPTWIVHNSDAEFTCEAGQYIAADTTFRALTYKMPLVPVRGDTLVVKDTAGYVGEYPMLFNSSAGKQFKYKNAPLDSWYSTKPFSTVMFIYDGAFWIIQVLDDTQSAKSADTTSPYKMSSGDTWYRKTSIGVITLILPLYANHGDMINVCDVDNLNSVNPTLFKRATGATYTINGQASDFSPKTIGDGMFVFDKFANNWVVYDSDIRARLIQVSSDVTMRPNSIYAVNSKASTSITMTLPDVPGLGDIVEISLKNVRRGQTVTVKGAGTSKILSTRFGTIAKYKDQGTNLNVDLTQSASLVYTGTNSNLPDIKLGFDGTNWLLFESTNNVERVDSTNRARIGVAPLATQAEVNKDKEANPDDESIVTPLTLASKIATKDMRGIAYLVGEEILLDGPTGLDTNKIVTVADMDRRRATETRAGVAELATQAEANGATDDIRIVTPKKLNDRKATPTQTGIAATVTPGGVLPTTRPAKGTGIFDVDDAAKIVTPKVLSEYKATENQVGAVFLATENEVQNGLPAPAQGPTAVTPEMLGKRRATEGNHGLIELATQPETDLGADDVRAVTPKKLNDRRATEALTGLSRFATKAEFEAGLIVAGSGSADNARGQIMVSPEKVKDFFSATTRLEVTAAAGLTTSSNLWAGQTINILMPTESQRGTTRVAIQNEVLAGVNDNLIVTPKKFIASRATESQVGTTQFATQAEINTGTADNLVISPKNFKSSMQESASYVGNSTRRGTLTNATEAGSFVGNETEGSTQAYNLYQHENFAVTPRGMHFALKNYLPKLGQAEDTRKLGGVVASSWMRRDIAQTNTGANTWTQLQTINNSLTVTGVTTTGFLTTTNDGYASVKVGDLSSAEASGMLLRTKANHWTVTAGGTSTVSSGLAVDEVGFIAVTDTGAGGADRTKFKVNRTTGDITAGGTVRATNHLLANNDLYLGGNVNVAGASPTVIRLGSSGHNMQLSAIGYDSIKIVIAGGASGTMLNTGNFTSHLNGTYVRRTGGYDSVVMGGNGLVYAQSTPSAGTIAQANNSAGIYTYINELPSETTPSGFKKGNWTMDITNATIYNTYPKPNAYGENKAGQPGTLVQFCTSDARIVQHWYPKGFEAFFMRTASGSIADFTVWSRVYTSQVPPVAEEIAGVMQEGKATDFLNVRDYIQIGDVRITVNKTTKGVEFEWVGL